MQQIGGLRGFVQRPIGRTALLAFAILVTFATYVYLSTLLAIPVILLVGLGVPIWLGIKRLRTLAMFGLVILLLVAPLATVVITADVRTPIPVVSSPVLTWSNGTIAFPSSSGTFAYEVGSVDGYSTPSSNGSLFLNGANQSVALVFTLDTVLYAVTFTETGLQTGTSWSATFGALTKSSTTTTIVFAVSNGTYAYAVPSTVGQTASPNLGSVVVNGVAVNQAVTFTASSTTFYSVTYTESGLPAGTDWSVTTGNGTSSTSTSQVVVNETNGSYSYTVGNVHGFLPQPSGGMVTVAGADTSVAITFTASPKSFEVTFDESGLPTGVGWNVTFDGTAEKGTTVGESGSIMQAAQVTPYLGGTSTNFTWNVTIVPSAIPGANSSPLWVNLYISTCPGATSPTGDPACNAGYPFWLLNSTFSGPMTHNTTVSFHFTLPSDSIWAWQMGLYLRNLSVVPGENASPFTYILLQGDPVYNGLEGPVTGDYTSTYSQLILTVYLNDFIYLGVPYFVVLLVYSYITRRKASRADMVKRAAGPTPGDSDAATPGPSRPTDAPDAAVRRPAPLPRRPEMNCPNCGAVVYPNETACWKCGTKLTSPPASAPLPSDPPKST